LTNRDGKTEAAAAPEQPSPSKSTRRRRGLIECQLGLLMGIAGLVGSRLGQLWIAFDVFSQFTLQFAAIALAFLVGVLVPRARLLAAFVVLMAGLLGIGMWPHVVSRSVHVVGELRDGERAVRVATFNTWYNNAKPDELKAEVAKLDADIVTLVELGPGKQSMLDALLPVYPFQANCLTDDFCNMAILSKLPIESHGTRVNWEGPPLITATFGPATGGLTVLGVHTIRFPHSRSQFRQVQALDSYIDAIPGNKLMMGDFNATPFSRIIATITARTGMTRLTSLPTWPSGLDLPQVAIDHIFVSEGIRPIEDERIGEAAGSDHYPIIMTLAVPKG
jgi:endonuclease/exonuclease/phosphatase (EEP) superfamily protein YafD